MNKPMILVVEDDKAVRKLITTTIETQDYQSDNYGDTLDWWKTYDLPKAPGSAGGYMPLEGFVGNIITVSKKAALNAVVMDKICRLIDDVICYTYEDDGIPKYFRGAAYDALRWGVGVEESLRFQNVDYAFEGKTYTFDYININSNELNYESGGRGKYYRDSYPGAWDWGCWFSTTGDGVVQGTSAEITPVTRKVIEHNLITANMPMRVQIGAALNLNPERIKDITARTWAFEYKYIYGQPTGYAGDAAAQYENGFLPDWKSNWGGLELMSAARTQFEEFGLI